MMIVELLKWFPAAPPGVLSVQIRKLTTAIRDFLEAELPQSTPVYWFFTATDETPAAGFRRLCREIEKIDSHAGERLLKIELPNAATIGEATEALRSIQCKHETYLVIDNYQFLQAALPPTFSLHSSNMVAGAYMSLS